MMQRRLAFKMITIVVMMLILLVPLGLVQGIINERADYRNEVYRFVEEKWTGRQTIAGPFLIQPYKVRSKRKEWNKETKRYDEKVYYTRKQLVIRPREYYVEAAVAVEKRQRGIYEVPVYTADLNTHGRFSNEALLSLKKEHGEKLILEVPFVSIALSDMRGIKSEPVLSWQNEKYPFTPGSGIKAVPDGLQASIDRMQTNKEQDVPFSVSLSLRGMKDLNIVPAGENSELTMRSDWPHPGFSGRHLPESPIISDQGFKAHWVTSPYSGNLVDVLQACLNESYCEIQSYAVGAEFVQPVDTYVQSERSTKYGILFMGITFIAFFLFEVLKKLQLHPVQYGMVGLSLAVFYLLLVSLAEHMSFLAAYVSATTGCVALITLYLVAVLRSHLWGVLFGSAIAALYTLLYVIVSSEDFALLMGAVLVFAALAVTMLMTRKLDWYQVGQQAREVRSS